MNTALLVLFAFAGSCALAAIWQAVSQNLGAISALRHTVRASNNSGDIIVTFREHVAELAGVSSIRRPRQIRVPAPKPITHRLHHFAKESTAA